MTNNQASAVQTIQHKCGCPKGSRNKITTAKKRRMVSDREDIFGEGGRNLLSVLHNNKKSVIDNGDVNNKPASRWRDKSALVLK